MSEIFRTPKTEKPIMTKFKTGDVVRLKSGSPKMTVKGQDDGAWAVQWIDRNGKLQSDTFPADMLDIFLR